MWASATKCLVNILNAFNEVKGATLWIFSFLLIEWMKEISFLLDISSTELSNLQVGGSEKLKGFRLVKQN